ncbi:TPA: RIO1 family regulatory kinase/ATPase [Providencia alcalifaciens]|uniref:OspG family effector kinase n=1 Tax=Providencia alcalifaciens TaxID=126385 RepID=UPI001CC7D142|nr:hypothetical protein NVI2019_NGLDDFDA_03905 [Providencia alcalifaciens]
MLPISSLTNTQLNLPNMQNTEEQNTSNTKNKDNIISQIKTVRNTNTAKPKFNRQLLRLDIPKQQPQGQLLGASLCGEVREDLHNPGFVLKDVSRLSIDLIKHECESFNKFYGENSAEIVHENNKCLLRMFKVPGKPLSHCSPEELPKNADSLFLRMISELSEARIIHGDLHRGNIMYDPSSERFWPIDISSSYERYYSMTPLEKEFIDRDNTNRFEHIMAWISSRKYNVTQ